MSFVELPLDLPAGISGSRSKICCLLSFSVSLMNLHTWIFDQSFDLKNKVACFFEWMGHVDGNQICSIFQYLVYFCSGLFGASTFELLPKNPLIQSWTCPCWLLNFQFFESHKSSTSCGIPGSLRSCRGPLHCDLGNTGEVKDYCQWTRFLCRDQDGETWQ